MALQKLAYAELRVPDLEAALAFDVGVLGLDELAREDGRVYLGCDRSCDLILSARGTGAPAFALAVDTEEELERCSERLRAQGVDSERRSSPAPGHESALRFRLPSGHALELVPAPRAPIYPHPADADGPAPRGIAPADVDHITIGLANSDTMKANVELLRGALGFRVSDIVEAAPGDWLGAWTRAGEYHHDVAMLRCGPDESLHHLAWRLGGLDHLKAAADRLALAGLPLEAGLGRHGVGGNLYAYFWTPGGNRYELSAEMPRVAGARDEPHVRLAAEFNSFSAWGTQRPDTFTRGS
jgi:catechol 2,3-dioxygenase